MKFELILINGQKSLLNNTTNAYLFELYSYDDTSLTFLFRVCEENLFMLKDFVGTVVDIRPTMRRCPAQNPHIDIILPTKKEIGKGDSRIKINGQTIRVYTEIIAALSSLKMGRYITIEGWGRKEAESQVAHIRHAALEGG